jgi:beta-galactosidase
LFSPVNAAQALDVVGLNYQSWAYDRYHKEHPTRPMTSTEDTSAYMSRGEFQADQGAHVLDGYDDQPSSWGSTHRDAWRAIAERRFIAGSFLWTGIDYRGEPSPFEWPSASSFFGAMDLDGFPKAAFYIHQAHWVKDRPVLKILPHWNWPGREGQPIKVMVATNAPRVRLLLNGKVVAQGDVDPIDMASFDVPYTAGVLEAVALRGDAVLARDRIETSGPPARLVLTPDRDALANDGLDAVPVTVSAVDAQGRPVPVANPLVRFDIEGQGNIIGVGNGDPNSHEADKADERSLYNGLAQVIVQSRRGGTGSLTLHASADGLQDARAELVLRRTPALPSVPATEPLTYLQNWRISPAQAARPDPNVVLAGNDMNSWGWGEPPMRQESEGPPYRLYRSELNVRADANDGQALLVFRIVAGNAEVCLKLGEKSDPQPGPLSVRLPRGAAHRQVTLLVQSRPGQPSGILDRIFLQRGIDVPVARVSFY